MLIVICAVTLLTAQLSATQVSAAQVSATASAAPGGRPPVGQIDILAQDGIGFQLRGWAVDPDTSASATVKVRVDGTPVASVQADRSRPDIALAHPSYGPDRGFQLHWPATIGTHRVCAYALNYPSIDRWLLGCRLVTISHNPSGSIRSVAPTPGFLRVPGWAIDPDRPATARTVAIRVDGNQVARGLANLPFPLLDVAHPLAGVHHGFTFTFPITEGVHRICLGVVNVGPGVTRDVRCVTRAITFSPSGRITDLAQVPGGIRLAGYASDPDTGSPIDVTVTADRANLGTVSANDTVAPIPGHGFHGRFLLPGTRLTPGVRTVCAVGRNFGTYGKDRAVDCDSRYFNWNPSAGVDRLVQHSPGATITGWAVDPDTTAPIAVDIVADGTTRTRVIANGTGGSHPGHRFSATVPLPDGRHAVCAVAVNARYGSGNSPPACATVTLAFEPHGALETATRGSGSTDVIATGWAIDPDTIAAIPVQVSVDGAAPVTRIANIPRPDIAARFPGTGTAHGYSVRVPSTDAEHSVCVRAVNVLGGSGTTALGCKIVNAVHPHAPAAPSAVGAFAGYGGARVVWLAPTSDGGAPWSSYTIVASPGGNTMSVASGVQTATMLGLRPSTTYTFSVVANNVAGASQAGTSPAVTTEKEPPAQTSPAPISTSRYIRNIRGAAATELATLHREGAADAAANPSGHGYMIVLDLGGQDESRRGIVLSATIRFVGYADIVANLDAYIDGYASRQRPSAPLTIAIATNNDIDVSRSSGVSFANNVIDPVLFHTARYPGITIAGSDDMEPGFRASYAATTAWLVGYLSATTAPFIFTGSADGCSGLFANRNCNNGWTMAGLFALGGGMSAIRIISLPQVYNTTMAQQWRYISLTGVEAGRPRIRFGGALTEWTACHQAGGCASITGNSAWTQLWSQLRADPRLRPASLPYSTDLRIDS